MAKPPRGSPLRARWTLDPDVTYLNHGSFGACPHAVLEVQAALRARLERQPMRFMLQELEPLLDEALRALGAFVGAQACDLAFVSNATSGVNAVLRSLELTPDDQLLTTDHTYGACRNALDYVAARARAQVVVATVPFPITSGAQVVQAVLAATGPRTRLALIDHVTSPTALVWPVAELVRALAARGIDTLIDGAHAPGMVPLDLDALGAAYYVGNCHKWLCAPKAAGFLHVRRDRQPGIVPGTVSHGLTSPRCDKSRFRLLFDWVGTTDPSAALCVPAVIDCLSSLVPGGWPALMARNRALALEARRLLCQTLDLAPPAPDDLIGAMATVPLPDDAGPAEAVMDWLCAEGVEVPVFSWPAPPRTWLRLSAQLYNDRSDFERLAELLKRRFRPRSPPSPP